MNYLPLLAAVPMMAAHPGNMAAMQWERRVLLVSAPTAQDAALTAQRRIVAGWKTAAAARDLSLVEIVGHDVSGATDSAAALRHRYQLPENAFVAILIGKDGGEKLRSASPVSKTMLEQTIDAMPMRRNGRR